MELSIQERLKDLRVERGLTLEQLEEQVNLSKSALGSYEAKDFKDISHYAIIKLAKFYGVTADYLLGLSQTKNHPNADLADLRLSDDMIELLKSGRVNNSLLCELAVHPDFPRLMADLEIYVNGVAVKQVQAANAIVDTMSATIMKRYNPGLTDPQLRQLVTAHIDDDSFCRYVIQQDIKMCIRDRLASVQFRYLHIHIGEQHIVCARQTVHQLFNLAVHMGKLHLQGGDFRVCLCRFFSARQRFVACQLLQDVYKRQARTPASVMTVASF